MGLLLQSHFKLQALRYEVFNTCNQIRLLIHGCAQAETLSIPSTVGAVTRALENFRSTLSLKFEFSELDFKSFRMFTFTPVCWIWPLADIFLEIWAEKRSGFLKCKSYCGICEWLSVLLKMNFYYVRNGMGNRILNKIFFITFHNKV